MGETLGSVEVGKSSGILSQDLVRKQLFAVRIKKNTICGDLKPLPIVGNGEEYYSRFGWMS